MDELLARIRRVGAVPFRTFMDAALYGPTGFYTSQGGAGRRGDFLTSPETGTLFGAVVAQALDAWWRELEMPDPFVVVECGAGPGALARAVHRAAPACAPALRYVLVDVSPRAQAAQRLGRLPFAELAQLLGSSVAADDDDGSRAVDSGQGPLYGQSTSMPAGPVHVVLANELLDNLPFDVYEHRGGAWHEVRVGATGNAFEEVLVAGEPTVAAVLDRLCEGDVPEGGRVPWMAAAASWVVESVGELVDGGRLVCVDYARSHTAVHAQVGAAAWLRTYRGHERAGSPLDDPGTCDITADVAVDQLARVRRPALVRSQAEFLRTHGIEALVEEARARWIAAASRPTLGDLTARSWVSEAEALLDPDGLGGFTVLEWRA